MQGDKLRFGVPRKYPVPHFQKFGIGRKSRRCEGPVWMVAKFLISLIEAVGWTKECQRIRYMDSNRHIQAPACLPHRIKPGIIDLYQVAGSRMLAEKEAECLQDL